MSDKSNTQGVSFSSLNDLLTHYGVDTAGRLGRCFYKYTDCGPWTVFLVKRPDEESKTIYYEDQKAYDPAWYSVCAGLRIGSIVEGSDVECSPVELYFPFTESELDAAVENVNDEACFYWERDNSLWLKITSPGGVDYWGKETWGAWDLPADVPENVARALMAMVKRGDLPPPAYDTPLPVIDGWQVEEYLNDYCY